MFSLQAMPTRVERKQITQTHTIMFQLNYVQNDYTETKHTVIVIREHTM